MLSPPGDDAVAKLGDEEGEDHSGAVRIGSILLEPVLPFGASAFAGSVTSGRKTSAVVAAMPPNM